MEYYEPEFMRIGEFDVLLPVEQRHHPHITVLRQVLSTDSDVLTLFLRDTTYVSGSDFEMFEAGRLAICERMDEFYIATVYHEWFIVENEGLGS